MIKVLYLALDEKLEKSQWLNLLQKLPHALQQKAIGFMHWRNRQSYLIGKLLIKKGLREYGYAEDCLQRLKYNDFQKPFVDSNIYFNLSHSGKYIVCAFCSSSKVGIDIERVRSLNISVFENVFTPYEWQTLNKSTAVQKDFFKIWTIKESITKAIGKGLFISLNQIETSFYTARYESENWYHHEVSLNERYVCTVVSQAQTELEICEVDLSSLMCIGHK